MPAVALLESIPGIGAYRALVIATETLPITRIRTPGHLVSYAGLAPRSSQSGLRPIRHGSIPVAVSIWSWVVELTYTVGEILRGQFALSSNLMALVLAPAMLVWSLLYYRSVFLSE